MKKTKLLFSDFDENRCFVFNYRIKYFVRLDELITSRYKRNLKRTKLELANFISERIRVNEEIASQDQALDDGDVVQYLHKIEDEKAIPQPIELLYEDDAIIAIEKPIGFPVTPSIPYYFNSVVLSLRRQFKNEIISPLHRLDIDTCGVLLFYKKKSVSKYYNKLFQDNAIDKTYKTVVYGTVDSELKTIQGKIVNDQNSLIYSKYKLIEEEGNSETILLNKTKLGDFTELELKPITGKTNQLRIHLAHYGHSIVGDKKYYPDENVYINWFHDNTSDERMILDNHILVCSELCFKNHMNKEIKIQSNMKRYNEQRQKIEKITKP